MIGFIGMSHLGINTSAAVAAHGFDVLCFDSKTALIENMKITQLPIHEPGLEDLFKKHAKHFSFSSNPKDLAKCDLIYVSMDVPTNANNESNVQVIRDMLLDYKSNFSPNSTVVILSQVHPGFTRPFYADLKKQNVALYYQVETLIFGVAVERALHPERYIIGCADPEQPLPATFDKLLKSFDCPILPMKYESAELAKIAINFYLVSQVSVTNTLAEVCERVGASWNEIAPSLRLDRRIGPYSYLGPGLGLAGGNLERDLLTIQKISREQKTESSVIDAWLKNSTYRKDWVTRELNERVLNAQPSAKLAVWGLAYKVGTHSLKNAPSLQLLDKLKNVKLKAYDPHAQLPGSYVTENCQQVATSEETLMDADALVILTPYDEFKSFSIDKIKSLMKGRTVIDPFQVLNQKQCNDAGLKAYVLGVGI